MFEAEPDCSPFSRVKFLMDRVLLYWLRWFPGLDGVSSIAEARQVFAEQAGGHAYCAVWPTPWRKVS